MEMRDENKEQFFANELKHSYHLLSPKSKKPARLYMLVRMYGKQYKLPIGVKVYPNQWNNNIQKAYVSDILTPLDNHNNTIVNNRINECTALFNDFKYYLCNNIEQNDTINILRNKLYTRMGKRSIKNTNPILYLKTETEKKYGNRSASTVRTFISNLTSLENYCKEKNITLHSIQDIDYNLLINYRSWLCQHPSKKYASYNLKSDISGINNAIVNIKTILKNAERLGEYDKAKAKIDNIEAIPEKLKSYEDMIALTEQELEALEALELEDKKERKARDMFLFSCYIGQRYSDVKNFKESAQLVEEDGKQYFKLRQKKTKKVVTIPVLEEAKAILDRNNWEISYPLKNDNLVNIMIKNICKMIVMDKEEITYHEDIDGIHDIKKKRYEIISTHTARRTFVTIAYKKGIDIETIAGITGHDLKTIRMYLRITSSENADIFANAWHNSNIDKTDKTNTANAQSIVCNMTEVLERAKQDVFKEQIEEDKKALALLGADAIEIADSNTIDDIQQLICKYQQEYTDLGVDPYVIKALFHNSEYTTITEKRKQLIKIVEELKK